MAGCCHRSPAHLIFPMPSKAVRLTGRLFLCPESPCFCINLNGIYNQDIILSSLLLFSRCESAEKARTWDRQVKVCYDIDVRGHTNSKRETAGVCMELLIFGGIPVLTVAAIFLVKRKLLWAAPVISAALALIVYMVALGPVSMAEVFGNSEWRGFLLLAMLIQFGITAMLSAIAGFAAFIIRQKQTGSGLSD